ncbi:hypothetical protein YA0089_28080 [Pseudomonas viridiflava]|uniref:hypothetical protein n=1 Tax=Pseudomonas viridiflava TaxID=33069 RepID=UPI0018E5B0C2|nr:hypothetical protein [Pseudomonas viridiflava]MBI6727481.1 hypothetical protein [Pseudomonas viridiflava]
MSVSTTVGATHRITLNLNAPALRAIPHAARLAWVKNNLFEPAIAEEKSVLENMMALSPASTTKHQLDVEESIAALELALETLELNTENEPGSTTVLFSFDFFSFDVAMNSGAEDSSNGLFMVEINERLLSNLYVCAHMRGFGHLGVTGKDVLETDIPILEELDENLRILDWSSIETKIYFKSERK